MGIATVTNNCYPEAPDITVNAYDVSLGGTGVNYHANVFALGDSTSGLGLVFTLTHTPVQSAEVKVFLNGSLQRPTTDYTLTGTALVLGTALTSTDVLEAHYLGTT